MVGHDRKRVAVRGAGYGRELEQRRVGAAMHGHAAEMHCAHRINEPSDALERRRVEVLPPTQQLGRRPVGVAPRNEADAVERGRSSRVHLSFRIQRIRRDRRRRVDDDDVARNIGPTERASLSSAREDGARGWGSVEREGANESIVVPVRRFYFWQLFRGMPTANAEG